MKIRYLGTAAAEGCPALFCNCPLCTAARQEGGRDVRTRSQALIDDTLLVDFPPDTYHHVLSTPEFRLESIRTLLVTHSHADHFYPQDLGLRCSDFAAQIAEPLTVFCNDTVAAAWQKLCEGEYASFQNSLAEHIVLRAIKPYETVCAQGYTITALPANHKRDEMCYFYAIEKDGKRLLYANDTGTALEPGVWEWLSGRHFDAVSMDCTAMDRLVGRYHMGLPDNVLLREKLCEIGAADNATKFIVTHFSHFGGLRHEELQKRAQSHGMETAYDGFCITF